MLAAPEAPAASFPKRLKIFCETHTHRMAIPTLTKADSHSLECISKKCETNSHAGGAGGDGSKFL
jgi:hypothetical protein